MTILKEICSSLHGLHHLPVRLDNENNPATYRIKIKKMVERRIEGIIGVANSFLLVTKLFDTLKSHTMPIILIGRDMHGAQILSVTIDNQAGARLAIKHLDELGHRRIAFLCGPNDIIDNLQRWNGMTSFAAEACLQLDPKLSSHTKASCTSYDAGYLITFDDSTALIAIRALAVAERPVPAACSIVGFDDVMTSSYMNPSLTTVRRPMKALCSCAVEIFLGLAESFLLEQKMPVVHHQIEPRLIVYASRTPLVEVAKCS